MPRDGDIDGVIEAEAHEGAALVHGADHLVIDAVNFDFPADGLSAFEERREDIVAQNADRTVPIDFVVVEEAALGESVAVDDRVLGGAALKEYARDALGAVFDRAGLVRERREDVAVADHAVEFARMVHFDIAPAAAFPPILVIHPGVLLQVEDIRAERRDAFEEALGDAVDGHAHERNRDDADDDAQSRQNRPHFIGHESAPGEAQAFGDFGFDVHLNSGEAVSDSLGSRGCVGFIGGDFAVADADDAAGSLGDILFVRDQNDGVAVLMKFIKKEHDFVARGRIQVAGRFIGQEDGGPVDQSARDGDTLTLTAREFIGLMGHAVAQSDLLEDLGRDLTALVSGDSGIDERQLHVVKRGAARQKIKSLKNEADFLIADIGQLIVIHIADRFAVEDEYPGSGRIQAAQDIHERGFARAAGAHDGHVFAPGDLQADSAQGVDDLRAHVIALADILQLNQSFGHVLS